MLFSAWVNLVALGLPLVSAFYVHDHENPTIKKDGHLPVGYYAAKAFAFNGPHTYRVSANALQKKLPSIPIKKRAVPQDDHLRGRRGAMIKGRAANTGSYSAPLMERVNGLKIVPGSQPSQSLSAAIDQDGTDFSYFAEVALGSSGKTFYMLLDTGAANTWVMGSDCTNQACSTHSTFGSGDSTTLQATTEDFTIQYGTGEVAGHVISDTIAFAGLNLSLSFGSASTTTDDFQNYPMDGILGLGRFRTNVMNTPTFMQTVSTAKLLPANIFGINLQRQSDGATDGEINFGAPDTTKYNGDLTWTNTVSGNQNWEIPVDDAFVDGTACGFTGVSAILDTGTSYMLIPPAHATTLFGKIQGSTSDGDYWHVPCSTTANIEIVFSGTHFSISPKDYVGPNSGGTMCLSHIIGHSALGDDTEWLVGDTFLKNVYSVYDVDQNRIGLGSKNAATSSGSSTSSSTSSTSPSSSGSTSSGTGAASGTSTSGSASSPITSPSSMSSNLPILDGLMPGSAGSTSPSNGATTGGTASTSTTALSDTSGTSPVPNATSGAPSPGSSGSTLTLSMLSMVLLVVPACLISLV